MIVVQSTEDKVKNPLCQGTQSIDRAAALLMFVINAPAPVSFTDVVDHSGMARSTVSRLLASLHDNGLLERMPDGAYRGRGTLFAAYAARFDRTEALAAARLPPSSGSGRRRGAVNLGLPSGGRVVDVAQVDSTYVLGAANWVDIDVPIHCSALGMVLSETFVPLELAEGIADPLL